MPSTATDRIAGLTTSVAVKAPVRAVSTENLTLSGLQTVGGVSLADGDRVLVKSQDDPVENGVYVASSSAWSRAKDFDGARDAVCGTIVIATFQNGDALYYRLTTANPITIGESELAFSPVINPDIVYDIIELEALRGISPQLYAYAPGDVRRYDPAANDTGNDLLPLQCATGLSGYAQVFNGTYRLTSKLQVTKDLTLVGENRENTIIKSAGFADYLIEIGDGVNRANCGLMQRLKIQGAAGNLGCIHIQQSDGANPPSLWLFDQLVFPSAPCPAIVSTQSWDSNFTNIDILGCVGSGNDPATAASWIFDGTTQSTNNHYLRGVRIEAALAGAIWVGWAGPVWFDQGKIDNGFSASQRCAAITLGQGYSDGRLPSKLGLNQVEITGVYNQYHIDSIGELTLGDVTFQGGSNKPAAIYHHPAWFHMNPTSWTGSGYVGPLIAKLDLGHAKFTRGLPFVGTTTDAAVLSKIYPIRALAGPVTVGSDTSASASTRQITTDATTATAHQYTGCYLVHNSDGYKAASRRKILSHDSDGTMVVAGSGAVTLDAGYSIEFCGQHATPGEFDGASVGSGMGLFASLATGCTISGLSYVSASGSKFGQTTMTLTGASGDLTGYFLVDEITGEPYYINYGLDGSNVIGVMYDRTGSLDTSHSYSIVAGYNAGVRQEGTFYVWTYAGEEHRAMVATADANGFDINNLPLWDYATVLKGSTTLDPASLADGAGATVGPYTVTGAEAGDFVQASFSLDSEGIITHPWISAANTLYARLQNESGAPLDLGNGVLSWRVTKKDAQ